MRQKAARHYKRAKDTAMVALTVAMGATALVLGVALRAVEVEQERRKTAALNLQKSHRR